jgi:hypothetical protein
MQHDRRSVIRYEAVDRAVAAVLRQKTGAERWAIASGLWRSARCWLEAHLRSQHPDWPAEKIDQAVAERIARGSR